MQSHSWASPARVRWVRYAHTHLAQMFPHLPQRSGYNERLRKSLNASWH